MADEDQKSYYERDGIQYPRVTHILKVLGKPGLDRWRGRLGNSAADDVAREGSRIGTEFHALAVDINRGDHQQRGWQAPGEYRHMAAAYIDWLHRYVAKIHQIEQTYYYDPPPDDDEDDAYYAGTLDLLATFRGDEHPSIIDLKTSNNYSTDWPLQLSAYKRMVERAGIKTQRRVIIRIPKVGAVVPEMFDFSKKPCWDEKDDRAWRRIVQDWQWSQEQKDRKKESLVVAGL